MTVAQVLADANDDERAEAVRWQVAEALRVAVGAPVLDDCWRSIMMVAHDSGQVLAARPDLAWLVTEDAQRAMCWARGGDPAVSVYEYGRLIARRNGDVLERVEPVLPPEGW